MNVTSMLNLTNRTTNVILCGYCNTRKDDLHDDNACGLLDKIENRELTWEDVLNQYPDYYADDTIPVEESNVEATEITRDMEWDGIYANRDITQTATMGITRYNDVEPERCTHAIAWTYKGHEGSYGDRHMPKPIKARDKNQPLYVNGNKNRFAYRTLRFTEESQYNQTSESLDYEDRRLANLTFNELQSMASVQLIDYGITERYHYHFFNAFWGRDEKFHIGSISFDTTVDNRKRATCTKCTATLVAPAEPTKDQQRTFTSAAIRHGNNHGPTWLTKRSDFTFIHANNCDTKHEHSTQCNSNVDRYTVEELTTENEAFEFLMHHRRFCTSNTCRCTHYYHLLNERNYINV